MRIVSRPADIKVATGGISFCYLCGESLKNGLECNRDHVPPRVVFAPADRINPLILNTHEACNTLASWDDERVGEMLALMHGRVPKEKNRKLKYHQIPTADARDTLGAVEGVDLYPAIWRYVRAFHAVLYQTHLPVTTKFKLSLPYPESHTLSVVDLNLLPDPVHTALVDTIRINRIAGQLDCLCVWCAKCKYDCTWTTFDDGDPVCVFALRIYNWEDQGSTSVSQRRGCVGLYAASPPPGAARATSLVIPLPSGADRFDAFADQTRQVKPTP